MKRFKSIRAHSVANLAQHKNGLARPSRYLTLTKYKCEVSVAIVMFHPMNKSLNGLLHFPSPPSPFHYPIPSSIRYLIPTQEPGHILVTTLRSRVTMGGGDQLLSGGSHARLPLENSIQKTSK
ncbi:hypothetical protein EVAR_69956_1 [Eumeta japonica]|uniref:Uncharacterized protein n=1 Tax=Eumeta variegata TaxID=151549 RepID=A0A4C2ABQ7_EUMVA|nr:hypothetical protein EVAR_69956_1 [Eumeta japonica]